MDRQLKSLRREVLHWLDTMKIPGSVCRYKFDRNSDDSIFTSCFALFIYDLFKETDEFTSIQKNIWVEYIQGFQDETTGYFEPIECFHKDIERNTHQLTAFCISALRILNTTPKYSLSFVYTKWSTNEQVSQYLHDIGVPKGKSGAGNKAMFMAIFLTYEYERTKSKQLLSQINTWFEFHNTHQNPETGLWGTNHKDRYFNTSQNGFHQVIIYDYWNKPLINTEKILSVLLSQQNKDGSFSPVPGGESCFDSDSIILLAFIKKRLLLNPESIVLKNALNNMFRNKNEDGGFAESKYFPKRIMDILLLLPNIISADLGKSHYVMRKTIGQVVYGNSENATGWVKHPRVLDISNLWDTWFRCLGISQIQIMMKPDDLSPYRFHKNIGIGFVHE
jgi:prenyltransferase beta subunit